MKRPAIAFAVLFVLAASSTMQGQEKPRTSVSFAVLGLFHPRELALEQGGAQVATAQADGARFVLNGEPGHRRLVFRALENRVVVDGQSATQWTAAARDGSPASFQLSIPGKLRRTYRGQLTVTAHGDELIPVIQMDRETAVASIVAAEMPADAPLEALKAQAVAARSFLAAGAHHADFDFCDTTHCQFLRSPPAASSSAGRATHATEGLILEYQQKPLAAMYSSRCGGQTHSLREVGSEAGAGYPYYSVRCAACRKHPVRWQSWIGANGEEPIHGNERKRLTQARLWGWIAVPGSDFTATRDEDGWEIEGRSIGHGVGLCQFGAAGMARSGAGFREILAHYYPNTTLATLP